jgi:hypothetical protein
MGKQPMKFSNKKIAVTICFAAFTLAVIASAKPDGDDDDAITKKNLKVIRKSITKDDLEVLMGRYAREVGVACNYCHSNTKGIIPERADFASDEKPEKRIARQMMIMTDKLNKKYFSFKNRYNIYDKPVISCKTCHRGLIHPSNARLFYDN